MELPETMEKMRHLALLSMAEDAKRYFSAEAESGPKFANERALERFYIRPRVLRDVSSVDASVSLLGNNFDYPIGLSPTGHHALAHPDAEIATARASAKEKCLLISSSASSQSLQDVANRSSAGVKWLQVYLFKDRTLTQRLIRIAEDQGFRAIVLTVDSPVRGLWASTMPSTYFSNYSNKLSNVPQRIAELLDPSLVFEDLRWIKSNTTLPIVVKGVLSGEGALNCAKNGASAIMVSNHGARQIKRVIPSIHALEEVVDSLRPEFPAVDVFLDGGVRSGSDVFVALALGAKAVFVGRPIIWGLAVGGEDGVRKVLQMLKSELRSTMQLAGVSSLGEITRDMVWHQCSCKI